MSELLTQILQISRSDSISYQSIKPLIQYLSAQPVSAVLLTKDNQVQIAIPIDPALTKLIEPKAKLPLLLTSTWQSQYQYNQTPQIYSGKLQINIDANRITVNLPQSDKTTQNQWKNLIKEVHSILLQPKPIIEFFIKPASTDNLIKLFSQEAPQVKNLLQVIANAPDNKVDNNALLIKKEQSSSHSGTQKEVSKPTSLINKASELNPAPTETTKSKLTDQILKASSIKNKPEHASLSRIQTDLNKKTIQTVTPNQQALIKSQDLKTDQTDSLKQFTNLISEQKRYEKITSKASTENQTNNRLVIDSSTKGTNNLEIQKVGSKVTNSLAPLRLDKLLATFFENNAKVQSSNIKTLNNINTASQTDLKQLLTRIEKNLSANHTLGKPVEKDLAILKSFIKQLPQATELNQQQLQKAIQQSGIFFEANLFKSILAQSSSTTLLSNDFKFILYTLHGLASKEFEPRSKNETKSKLSNIARSAINLTKPTPEQRQLTEVSTTDIDKALARVLKQQVFNALDYNNPPWLIDLLLKDQKSLSHTELFIEREKDPNRQGKKTWRVTIRFDLENLGAFKAIAKLENNRLSVNFRAENIGTQGLIKDHLNELENTLFKSGIGVGKLSSEHKSAKELLNELSPTDGVNIQV